MTASILDVVTFALGLAVYVLALAVVTIAHGARAVIDQ